MRVLWWSGLLTIYWSQWELTRFACVPRFALRGFASASTNKHTENWNWGRSRPKHLVPTEDPPSFPPRLFPHSHRPCLFLSICSSFGVESALSFRQIGQFFSSCSAVLIYLDLWWNSEILFYLLNKRIDPASAVEKVTNADESALIDLYLVSSEHSIMNTHLGSAWAITGGSIALSSNTWGPDEIISSRWLEDSSCWGLSL